MINMCGIGAIIGDSTQNIDLLMHPIKSRGETYNENVVLPNAVLSCNRLKIVDEGGATQPVYNEDKTIFAVFNGEIYNYKELQKKLNKKGHEFKTNSDSEILVHGYEEWGEDLPKYLDGQFSFVVYDKKTQEFMAARDPFGIKPLYFSKIQNQFYFASEIKQFVQFGSEINMVKPGFLFTRKKQERYYFPEDDTINLIRKLFDQAVKKRVQTDLPIAVFLSGGLDSSAVLATARKYHNDVTAICMGEKWTSESSDLFFAQKYCKENGIKLIEINPPSEEDLFELIPEIVRITESFEPNMIKQSGFSHFLAKEARRLGFKIVLSGEGADEIFAGYPEFQKLNHKKIDLMTSSFFNDLHQTQLQRVDRTSMQNTIEVRVPFMDRQFANFCRNIPAKLKVKKRITKWILRKAFTDRLPNYISQRKKVVLSEGMGHKSNSLVDGMFTTMIEPLVSNIELKEVQKNYPHYEIKTKEEVYYLKFFIKYGYDKAILAPRPQVNKQSSTSTNLKERIYTIIKRRRYNREKPHLSSELKQIISLAIKNTKPIELIGFWGIGPKSSADEQDKLVCKNLHELQKEVEEIYEPGLKFNFIFPIEHGLQNGLAVRQISKYVGDIQKLFVKYKFQWEYLDSLWEKHSINSSKINEILENHKDGWWEKIPHSEMFENSAKKHNKLHEPIVAAQKYFIMRNLEKKVLEKEFSSAIFHTFSSSKFRNVLPDMPTLHLYSHSGSSNCPWFDMKDSEEEKRAPTLGFEPRYP